MGEKLCGSIGNGALRFGDSFTNSTFQRYIGIDYSGAQTPKSSLKGLRVYNADCKTAAHEVESPPSPRKYWTRRGVAEMLVDRLSEGPPTLVGIDHGFSFPLQYFEQHGLPLDWPFFLEDFERHWPTDEDIYVDFVRDGGSGNGAARSGNSRWRRVTELRARTAKSVFHFDVQGSVAKSTHAEIPWLRYIRLHIKDHVHFWPFDGWSVPPNRSVVAEVYPSLWNRTFPSAGRLTNKTPLRQPNGCGGWTVMAVSKSFSVQNLNRRSARLPRLKSGFLGWCENGELQSGWRDEIRLTLSRCQRSPIAAILWAVEYSGRP
jgi:hypothetical protein